MSDGHRNPLEHAEDPRAPDLAPEELAVAAWFEHLERPAVPARLESAVLGEAVSAPARPRLLGRVIEAFPLGAWGVASAAVLLLALSTAATVELTDPAPVPAQEQATATTSFATDVTILEDATMALFRDVETFDEIGLSPGELIADWGR